MKFDRISRDGNGNFPIVLNGRFGVLDPDFKPMIEAKFNEIWEIPVKKNWYICLNNEEGCYLFDRGEKVFVSTDMRLIHWDKSVFLLTNLNSGGDTVEFLRITKKQTGNEYDVTTLGKYEGIVSLTGDVNCNTLTIKSEVGQTRTYLGEEGEAVVTYMPCTQFMSLDSKGSPFLRAIRNTKYALFHRKHGKLTKFVFDFLDSTDVPGLVWAMKKNEHQQNTKCVLDEYGEVVIPYVCTDGTDNIWGNGHFFVRKAGLYEELYSKKGDFLGAFHKVVLFESETHVGVKKEGDKSFTLHKLEKPGTNKNKKR